MRIAVSIAVLLGAFGACGGALSEGESQFEKGRYPEAKQAFASIETESRTWSDAKRAEYALFRGLTYGALGDRAQAGLWLREARAIEDAHHGSLSPPDAQRLKVGLESYEVP
jgi:hypothetical protein